MFNIMAKTLVLIHAFFSVAGMGWAIMIVLNDRDLGRMEPIKEVLSRSPEGNVTAAVLHASELDKSVAALTTAGQTRDRTYAHVKKAIDSLRAAEPYLANNHLFYVAELRRLQEAPDKIEVKRLEKGGIDLEVPELGKPKFEAKAVENVDRSHKVYEADLKKLYEEIAAVDTDSKKIADATKKLTAQLTGTDEANQYVHPGLYQLIDLEFKFQERIKKETDEIKPQWSGAIERSRRLQDRRTSLEANLEKLKRAVPAPKDNKKL